MTLKQLQRYNEAIVEIDKEKYLMDFTVQRMAAHGEEKEVKKFLDKLGVKKQAPKASKIPKEWIT